MAICKYCGEEHEECNIGLHEMSNRMLVDYLVSTILQTEILCQTDSWTIEEYNGLIDKQMKITDFIVNKLDGKVGNE